MYIRSTMKTAVCIIFLFGFGWAMPLTCGKQRSKDVQKKEQSMREATPLVTQQRV